jgi:hypothetical protein
VGNTISGAGVNFAADGTGAWGANGSGIVFDGTRIYLLGQVVERANIEPGAATGIFYSDVADVPVTGESGSPFGPVSTIAQLSFTAAITGSVLLQISGSATYTTGSSDEFGGLRTAIRVGVNGGSLVRDSTTVVWHLLDRFGLTTTRQFPVNQTKRFSVVAGSTYVFDLVGQRQNGEATAIVNNLEMRIEEIRR